MRVKFWQNPSQSPFTKGRSGGCYPLRKGEAYFPLRKRGIKGDFFNKLKTKGQRSKVQVKGQKFRKIATILKDFGDNHCNLK
jgi:hypothetical protein